MNLKEELIYFEMIDLSENPNTPPKTLDHLANDKNLSVRWSVADNPNTPPKTLDRLANDKNLSVRWSVADNPNTPQYVKEYLTAVEFMEEVL